MGFYLQVFESLFRNLDKKMAGEYVFPTFERRPWQPERLNQGSGGQGSGVGSQMSALPLAAKARRLINQETEFVAKRIKELSC